MEAMMGMDMEVDDAEGSSSPSKPEGKSGKVANKSVKVKKERIGSEEVKIEPGRKRRQVKKSKTEVDSKGYTGESISKMHRW